MRRPGPKYDCLDHEYSSEALPCPQCERLYAGGKGTLPAVAADDVAHPPHYNRGKIEVIEFIEDQKLGFHLGNATKYICRAGAKDNTPKEKDLRKAIWYLTRELELLKPQRQQRRPNDMTTEK